MIDVTTANYRKLVRMSSQEVVLFTEMIVSSTVVHIDREKLKERLGDFDSKTVVQLGGSDPEEVSRAVKILVEMGYTLFNLNLGCPSTRVQKGCFGAVLMKDGKLVVRIINKVYEDTGVILSLKIRTGVDEFDTYDFFRGFIIFIVENTPANTFYVHARKCWLKGLSPKQNRNVPPLNYEFVYKIKEEMPHLKFIINGGIKTMKHIDEHRNLDGVMIGRAAMDNVFIFHNLLNDDIFHFKIHIVYSYLISFGHSTILNYKIAFPIQNIMFGRKGCKQYKITLAEQLKKKVTVSEFIFNIHKFIY
jgi:tRNA-dihydrouridine synthase A